MPGYYGSDFVLNIAIERCECDGRIILSFNQGCQIQRLSMSTMAKLRRTSFMLCWEDDDKWTEHVATTRCVLVGFAERSLTWAILHINKSHNYGQPHRIRLTYTTRHWWLCYFRDLQEARNEQHPSGGNPRRRIWWRNSRCPFREPCDTIHHERFLCWGRMLQADRPRIGTEVPPQKGLIGW